MKGDDCILVNKMYTGSYLKGDNIGHEVINTFLSDNGKHYIYVNAYGTFNAAHKDHISRIVLVRSLNVHEMEVIGVAEDLKLFLSEDAFNIGRDENDLHKAKELLYQIKRIEDEEICYGGLSLDKLFADQDNTTYITYEVGRYRSVREDRNIYLSDQNVEYPGKGHKDTDVCVQLDKINFPSQKMYALYYDEEHPDAYRTLSELISNDSLWSDSDISVKVDIDKKRNSPMNIMKVIRKESSELPFSNWLAFYLENDDVFLRNFMNDFLGLEYEIGDVVKVIREYRNIDIFIKTSKFIVVIENKLLSDINGRKNPAVFVEAKEISQLSKYYDIAQEEAYDRECKYFMLVPNYSEITRDVLDNYYRGSEYKIMTYRKLYAFLKDQNVSLPYLEEFIKAIYKHTRPYAEEIYREMEDRFIDRIRSKRNLKARVNTIE